MKHIAFVSFIVLELVTQSTAQTVGNPSESRPRSTNIGPPMSLPPVPNDSQLGVTGPTANSPTAPLSLEDELSQLRSQVDALRNSRSELGQSTKQVEAESLTTTNRQRQEILEMLNKLTQRAIERRKVIREPRTETVPEEPITPEPPAAPVVTERAAPPPAPKKTVVADSNRELDLIAGQVVDPFALGKVLFRSGDFAGAEHAFRLVESHPENRMLVQYLIATCLRKRGLWKEATAAYRVVLHSNSDPVLRDLAKWQLENVRWHQEITEFLVPELPVSNPGSKTPRPNEDPSKFKAARRGPGSSQSRSN